MQRLEVRGAVRPLKWSLGVKGLETYRMDSNVKGKSGSGTVTYATFGNYLTSW